MRKDAEFQFERFEDYYGEIDEVTKQVNHCPECDGHFTFTHITDYKNLNVQETSKCTDCGYSTKKKIHIIN